MKKLLLFASALLMTINGFSQGADFSGSWKLNTEKSRLGDQFSLAPSEIIVTQSGNDFLVEKHSTFQEQELTTKDKFTLDGNECINTGWQDSQKKSTAIWDENKQTLKITSKLNIGDAGEVTIIEIFKMDGPSMVIDSSASSSYGDLAEVMVYDKI
jgi:hypothetical protein